MDLYLQTRYVVPSIDQTTVVLGVKATIKTIISIKPETSIILGFLKMVLMPKILFSVKMVQPG